MTYSPQNGAQDPKQERAAIFVDYDNLYRTLDRTPRTEGGPAPLIAEMVEALQRSLLEDRKAQTVVTRAYADFAALPDAGEDVQRSLYHQGVEPQFVPRAGKEEVVDLQLCVDAMDLLHHRTDVTLFVLLTGRRMYLPLIRMFRRYGRQVLVAGIDDPASVENVPQPDGTWFFPAGDLLSAASRKHTQGLHPSELKSSSDGLGEIEHPVLVKTLEIIDEHFGQYEEVYLTPLLRKLSELLDETRHDPKNLISDLEDRGAVRLEKRRGFPHDYTVLIMEEHHPGVARVQASRGQVQTTVANYYEDRRDGQAGTDDENGSFRRNGRGEAAHLEPSASPSLDGETDRRSFDTHQQAAEDDHDD